MKILIPVADPVGRKEISRIAPFVKIAGKPIIAHILDHIKNLDVEELIFVAGEYSTKLLRQILKKEYHFKIKFLPQKLLLGEGHALKLAKNYIKDDVLVVFADTLVDTDFSIINKVKQETLDADVLIFVKETKDPYKYGVVVTNKVNFKSCAQIMNIVEKPDMPISDLAMIGVYYFKKASVLFKYLEQTNSNELKAVMNKHHKLSDGLIRMVNENLLYMEEDEEPPHKLVAVKAKTWLDFGHYSTLLAANHLLLQKNTRTEKTINSIIIPPVYFEKGVKISNSIIGPDVSVGKDTKIQGCIINNSIIGDDSDIEDIHLENSIVSDNVKLKGNKKQLNVSKDSEIRFD